MKFAQPFWLFGALLAPVVAALLVAGGVFWIRALKRFGDESLVAELLTRRSGYRRAFKGALLVLSVGFAFLALAQPQYGRGTRLIPATNLDVVIALDYSKSMYARDVKPFRIDRAKAEVARLIAELPGARFAAVAFAGQPLSFPLTSDGNAIAQFFRQLSPNDMPVGGTAIARALEAGRDLLARDPLSKKHRRVMVLVTDGEDLEGDPVSVANAAHGDGTTIHVVQIGGRTPEPLPEVNEAGDVTGMRSDENGAPITTSLSAEGEAQLTQIAEITGGRVVRSQRGETGISQVTRALKQMMTEELSERVETVYADVYLYPLSVAVLLLLIEIFVSETPRRARPLLIPPPTKRRPRRRSQAVAQGLLLLGLLLGLGGSGCEGGPGKMFIRHSPAVDDAIQAMDGGDAAAAVSLLEEYLSTGKCQKGAIGAPDLVRDRPNAAFDLSLGLFRIGEQFGQRFGIDDTLPDGGRTPEQELESSARREQVECALRIVRLAASDTSLPIDLRARAFYLTGNLEFLRGEYRAAVQSYDLALRLIPGLPEDGGGDGTGRDAAWNRSIALQRIQQQEQRRDASTPDASPEAGPDAAKPDSGQPDAGKPDGGKGDAGKSPESQPDGGSQKPPPQPDSQDGRHPDAGAQPQPQPPQQQNQDERMLDSLERAPTLQEEAASRRATRRRVSAAEDK